jgi:hypothetical protein
MRLAIALAAAAALVACDGHEDYNGIGIWKFGHSTRGDVKTGRCDPTTLADGRQATWCYLLPKYTIAKRIAEVSLYFGGSGDDAPLIEIQLQIVGCVEDDVVAWMRTNFGQQIDERAKRAYWENPYLWAAAMIPDEPGRCTLHFLPRSETSEIARIKLL